MPHKTLKFRPELAKLILDGKKDSTWRLFDDKGLLEGDEVDLIDKETGQKFTEATLTKVWEKKMSELDEADFDGHEKFTSEDEMYRTYRSYYGDRVGPDTVVKIIRFELK